MGQVREPGRAFASPSVRYRRFGALGPLYEVQSVDGATARIRVVESGETLDYPVARMNLDPAA